MAGKVYLIGAGPGDPGLITVKGRDVLAVCDAVVYDNLISKEVLASPASTRRQGEAGLKLRRSGSGFVPIPPKAVLGTPPLVRVRASRHRVFFLTIINGTFYETTTTRRSSRHQTD